ncbi:uncharacterized protein LOC121403110 isoform X2 [Xenopus laevis]|uniref:Natural cytotoxicity triggering receptor 3 n=1 Tax=Xenopus laevis TaxID=8355 RepID=A0A8J1MZJ8_XENLA|nr:uncharacterized protein LOC121403110 isoform X2 [Xenopus laevis]
MRGTGLLLVLGALQGCLLQNMQVSQIPAVNSTEGSTVTLQCHYTLSSTENVTIGWYKWYRHVPGGPDVSNNNGDYTGRVSRASQSEFFNNRSANIQLHRVQSSDTGMYICEVTFVFSQTLQGHGNGTFLNVTGDVTDQPESSTSPHNFYYFLIVPGIMGIIVAVYIYTKYVSTFPREVEPCTYTDFTAQAPRIHANTPAQQMQNNEECGFSMENDQYTCDETEIVRNRYPPQACQDLNVYSELS